MKKILYTLTIIVSLFASQVSLAQTQSGCTLTFPGNYSASSNFSDIFDLTQCPSGNAVFDNFTAKNTGGDVSFDTNVSLNSLTINFASGNKPAELIIPSGVTVNITNDLTFSGQVDKSKFLTVEGTLIVGGTLDFGGIEFEIDGLGSIDAKDITGAGDVTCSTSGGGSGTCPTVTTDSCDDTPPGVSTFCEESSVTLPIELGSFIAKIKDNSVEINWITLSEINNDYFNIEKSTDGLNYETIASVKGSGNTTDLVEYSFTDYNPVFGRSYYRLKQTDFDGQSETFAPIAVEFSSLNSGKLSFTNPVRPGDQVTIFTSAGDEELLTVSVFNMVGAEIVSKEFSGSQYQFTIDNSVKAGVYFVKVTSINAEKTGRLVIQ